MRENSVDTRSRYLELPNGKIVFPAFMPDATFGAVRSLDPMDLQGCGIQAVVMNAFHLMQHPGSSVIRALGGLHKFSGWNFPIVTDSGGFQAYSLVRQNPKLGSLTEKGMVFRPAGHNEKILLTPEKSIQLQLRYGSDLLICLDDCTHVEEPLQSQQDSVRRTIKWAERCKAEFTKTTEQKHHTREHKPKLFAVVQGGDNHELREECAQSLLDVGFDGYAYGGYPLDSQGNLLTETIRFTRELIPSEFPMIALGVGAPENVGECFRVGYDLFDSSMPTRDARQGRLYVFSQGSSEPPLRDRKAEYSRVYVQDEKHIKSREPVSPNCDCLTCSNYSLSFLHHLYKRKDPLYLRLASIHNLRFIVLLVERLKESSHEA